MLEEPLVGSARSCPADVPLVFHFCKLLSTFEKDAQLFSGLVVFFSLD